jgi:chaperonin cofactor prefoldin
MSDNVVQLHKQSEQKEPVPEFITMSDIEKMTDEQLDEMLQAIRNRRLASYAVYRKSKDEINLLSTEKAKAKIEKKCEQIIKKLNTIDKQMDDLERYINELRGLRLQVGLEFM